MDVNKHHKFFSENFIVEISTPVEYSTKNGCLALWEKASKRHLTSKNRIFWRIRGLFACYLGFVTKNLIDTLSNLQIINIGQIGRLIQNWKFVILPIFAHFSHFFSKNFSNSKFWNPQNAPQCSQNHSFRRKTCITIHFQPYIKISGRMKLYTRIPKIAFFQIFI